MAPGREPFPPYAISLNVAGIPVLLVGGGAVAERKALALRASGVLLTVVSPTLTPLLREWAQREELTHIPRPYENGDVVRTGARLVFAATSSATVNSAVAREAMRRRVWVNVASRSGDESQPGSFAVPAVVRRDPLRIAVSTGGASPLLARLVREWLDERLAPELAGLARWMRAVRRRQGDGDEQVTAEQITVEQVAAAAQSWLRGDDGPLRLLHGRLEAADGGAAGALPAAPPLSGERHGTDDGEVLT